MSRPKRIASLLSSATEMLYALGLGDRIVAVSHECDYPAEAAEKPRVTFSNIDALATSHEIDCQVHSFVRNSQPLYGIDERLLARLQPDLIVTQAQCDVCAVKYEDVVQVARQLDPSGGLKVLALNPTSLDGMFSDMRRLGEATGTAAEVAQKLEIWNGRVAAVRANTEGLSATNRPRTVLVEWIEPLMLAGNWMPEVLELAGGACGLTRAGQHSAYVDWGKIIAYDPQVIVISPCGFDLPRTRREARLLANLPGWNDLAAVRAGRIFGVDGNAYFNRSGPRIIDSLEILTYLLHPEQPAPRAEFVRASDSWCRLEYH